MKLTLTEKIELTAGIRAYTFTAESDLPFIAGQFVMLKKLEDAAKNARAFSFASRPGTPTISFVMKHVPTGTISGFLADSEIGVQLETSKPLGRFVLNPADTDRVFIATGTGLAPIISFLEHEKITPSGVPHTTLFGVRDEASLYWNDKLPESSLITLSQPSADWHGLVGRVTAHVPELAAQHANAAWYLCGSPDMVKDVRAQLIEHGVAQPNIHFEIY